jgi:hypothetical protein
LVSDTTLYQDSGTAPAIAGWPAGGLSETAGESVTETAVEVRSWRW